MFFGFGKKKRKTTKRVKRPPTRLIKNCKKFGIKVTKRVGKKRVYKSVTVLKRLLKRKMGKKSKGGKRGKHGKRGKRKTLKRRFRFGEAADFVQSPNYGFNEKVRQAQGVLSQSSQVVNAENNINRPPGFGVDPNSTPIYGVYRPFFTEQVPTQVGSNSIGFMRQPDGSFFQVGGPISKYTSFGKRRKFRKNRYVM